MFAHQCVNRKLQQATAGTTGIPATAVTRRHNELKYQAKQQTGTKQQIALRQPASSCWLFAPSNTGDMTHKNYLLRGIPQSYSIREVFGFLGILYS